MAISARDRITRLTIYANESDMIDDINGTDYTDGVVDGTQRFEHIKFNSLPGFGEANAAMYKCEISGTTDLTGKWIRVRYCFYDTDSATTRTVEAVFAGKVDSCKYDRYHISRSLVAYDKIYDLRNIDISDWWSSYWSTANDSTAFEVFDAMCTSFGVFHMLTSSNFRNNFTILKDAQKGRKLGGCSFADFLKYVGQINGFYWEVLPSGMLTCTAPTASYPQSFDTYTDFKETTIEDADAEAYGTFTVYDGADIIYTSGTGEPTYTFSNNILLYGHTTASLVSILDITKNYLVWFVGTRPATVEVIYSQIPERQAISVTDNGTPRTCVISKNEMWGTQLINQRVTCTGNRVIGTQYSSALNRAANEIQKIGTELTYKVSAGNVIEAVNLEAQGGVQINAEALNINGVVTANGAFSIDLDGNPTIDATQASSFYADARLRAIDANNIAYYSSTGVRLSERNEIVPYVEWRAWYDKQSAFLAEYTNDNPLGRTADEAWMHSNHFETSRSVAVTPQSGETKRNEITGARVKSAPDESVVGDNAYGFVNYTAIEKTTAGIEYEETVESVFNKDKLLYTPNGSAPTIDIESSGNITAIGAIHANTLTADFAIYGSLNGSVYASNMLGSNSSLTPTGLTVDSKDILRTHQSLVGGWGTAIPANANLNTDEYCEVGRFYVGADTTAASHTNCPTRYAYMMDVFAPISSDYENTSYIVREIRTRYGDRYVQYVTGSTTKTYSKWVMQLSNASDNTVFADQITSRNFANNAGIRNGSFDGQGQETSANTRIRAGYVGVLPNTQYGIRTNTSLQIYEIHEYTSSRTFIKYTSINSSSTIFKTSSTTGYFRILMRYSDNRILTPDEGAKLQIERGEQLSAYSPNQIYSDRVILPLYSYSDLGTATTDSAFFQAWLKRIAVNYDYFSGKIIEGRVQPNVTV